MRCKSILYILLFISSVACSARQGYIALHEWQRQQCKNVIDSDEREHCLEGAKRTYEDYIKSEEYKNR